MPSPPNIPAILAGGGNGEAWQEPYGTRYVWRLEHPRRRELYSPCVPAPVLWHKKGTPVDPTTGALAFLAQASSTLSASLDYATTLAQVARLAVSYLADWCSVDIVAEDGSIQRVASAHADPRKEARALRIRDRFPYDPASDVGVPYVLRTGQPALYSRITPEDLRTAISDPEYLHVLEELEICSAIMVPMIARGRTLGALTLISESRDRLYTEADLPVALSLADRAALAVDNARLYRNAQREITERAHAEEELKRRAEELSLLYEAGKLLGNTLDPNRIYDTARTLLAGIMDCDALLVSTYSPEDNLIRCAYAWIEGERPDPAHFPEIPLAPEGKGIQSEVIRSGEPLLISDVEEEQGRFTRRYHVDADGSVHQERTAGKPTSRSVLYVPIKLEGQVLGVLQVMSHRPRAYTEAHQRMTEALLLQVAAAARNAHLYQKAQAEIAERRRAEEAVERLNQRLRDAMAETHHRVRNNLQLMAALLDMQLLDAEDTVPRSDVERMQTYIHTLAAVHEILTDVARVHMGAEEISARPLLERLLPQLRLLAPDKRVEGQIVDVRLRPRAATALAVITNELVSNALKHGASSVKVILARDGEPAELTVEDDGPGFPPDFDPEIAANTGLELVLRLSQWDLAGQTRFTTRPEGGGRVIVTFPVPHESASPTPA